MTDSTDRRKPSVWRNGTLKTNRSVNAVLIDMSENFLGPPGRPEGAARQAAALVHDSMLTRILTLTVPPEGCPDGRYVRDDSLFAGAVGS